MSLLLKVVRHLSFRTLLGDEKGAALVEYGMLVGLIAVICVASVTLLGQRISSAFSSIANALPSLGG